MPQVKRACDLKSVAWEHQVRHQVSGTRSLLDYFLGFRFDGSLSKSVLRNVIFSNDSPSAFHANNNNYTIDVF